MILIYPAGALVAGLLALFVFTQVSARAIARAHPPIGEFATVNGTRLHYVHMKAGPQADLPPIVFLHGASGNLKDQLVAFGDALEGRADLIFVDRPGHGWSDRGPAANDRPDGQAATVAALLDHLGMARAIIAGHSFGGATTASFALNHPDRTAGAVFLAPATHPWPGGIDWYYHLTALPVVGWLFSQTLVMPAGLARLRPGTEAVFTPNRTAERFIERTGVALVLRPRHFRANAIDVSNLLDYVSRVSPRYGEISAPSVVITGDRDAIVLPRLHSLGLKEALPDVELVWIRNLGHKPDYVATRVVVMAFEKLAGMERDLQAEARRMEVEIADDAFGPVERCLD